MCSVFFSSTKQIVSNSGLRQLRKEKKEYLKNTISRARIKILFNMSEEQICNIPALNEFGIVRYKKTDVVKALHRDK